MVLRPLRPLDPAHLDAAGWGWLYREAGAAYLAAEAVAVSEAAAAALASAADELYALAIETVEDLITRDALDELAVPRRMHRLVRETWEDDRHWHVVGRFDLAGGLAGPDEGGDVGPIKLIEFNADTPTSIPETSILQWALLKANDLPDAAQFNLLYERLVENLGRWRARNDHLDPTIVVTYAAGSLEDAANAEVVAAAALDAGFELARAEPLPALTFSAGEGVFLKGREGEAKGAWVRYDFVFKFIPWEWIVDEEPSLFDTLEELILEGHTAVANPPYALALQSKGLLPKLWRRFEGHPLLLEAHDGRVKGRGVMVEKPVFGREGANVRLIGPDGAPVHATPGAYDAQPRILQAFTDLPRDAQGRYYQSGVFFAHEACALGIRRGGLVLDDAASFVAHVVEG